MAKRRIWIEDGCIHCGWCQHLVPAVFVAADDGTRIVGTARQDGITSNNRSERSPLRAGRLPTDEIDFMPFVADGCPARVIHLDGWSGLGVADPALAPSRANQHPSQGVATPA